MLDPLIVSSSTHINGKTLHPDLRWIQGLIPGVRDIRRCGSAGLTRDYFDSFGGFHDHAFAVAIRG